MSVTPIYPTRGERNNNPGNLNYEPNIPWEGQLGIEIVPPGETYAPRFARFDAAVHGIRAIVKQLLTDQDLHDCRVLADFIRRWAPGNENDTASYIANVSQWTGIGPDSPVDMTDLDTVGAMARAIIRQENGRCLYDDEIIGDAVRLALPQPITG